MTREEAIKFLTLMRKAVSNFEEYGHDKASMVIECDKAEAIDMAIEALSNYITESPNDVVESQNDVIKYPRTMRYKLHKPIEYVSIEFDEEETITHIDHYTAYGERREP